MCGEAASTIGLHGQISMGAAWRLLLQLLSSHIGALSLVSLRSAWMMAVCVWRTTTTA